VVDSAREFVTIPADAIHPPAEGITGTSGRYLRGVATLGDRMIVILDVAELLNYDELDTAAVTVRSSLPQEK